VPASPADSDPHFIEAMREFNLILHGASPTRHRALIHFLYRDIELGPLEIFTDHITLSRLSELRLYEPCLNFLARYIKRMGKRSSNTPLVEIRDPLKNSWVQTHLIGVDAEADIKLLAPLQASLWHVQAAMCE
jgi:hypothetical protein